MRASVIWECSGENGAKHSVSERLLLKISCEGCLSRLPSLHVYPLEKGRQNQSKEPQASLRAGIMYEDQEDR